MASIATAAVPLISRSLAGPGAANATGYFENEFGINDLLCQRVLTKALSRGGDFADLFFEHSIGNWVDLEDGKVNQAYCVVQLGVGIRTVKGDQVGYGFTQILNEKSMLDAAATAATIASGTAKKPANKFIRQEIKNYYPLKKLLTSVPLESKLPLVQAANDRCFALSPHIIKVSAGFHDRQKRILVVTSDGVKTEDLIPKIIFTPRLSRKRTASGSVRAGISADVMTSLITPWTWWRKSVKPLLTGSWFFLMPSRHRPVKCLLYWVRVYRPYCFTKPSGTGWKPISTGKRYPPTPP